MPVRRRLPWHVVAGFAVLASATASASGGCAPPTGGRPIRSADVYVGLGRRRSVVILDAVTDRLRGQVSLTPLGERVLPGQLGIDPAGNAAVLPMLSRGPQVGRIAGSGEGGGQRRVRARDRWAEGEAGEGRQRWHCSWTNVGSGRSPSRSYGSSEVAQGLAVDARGRAYVLLADGGGTQPSLAAILDVARGTLLGHLELAGPGESVLALLAQPDGERLYAAVWRWDGMAGGRRGAAPPARGRLLAFDTRTGRVQAQLSLPDNGAVTHLALAAPPAGSGAADSLTIYAVTVSPGPSYDEDDWWSAVRRIELVSLDRTALDPMTSVPLAERPSAMAMMADGSRAYLLSGPVSGGAWSRRLTSLEPSSGVTHYWPLPPGCFSLAVSPVGKVYVTDVLGDRLWRVDTQTNTFLGALTLVGAPIVVAALPA
ncbi:MAG TPA: hypothetical protein VHS99_05905 [Chloroflexota bacterium]|nr:hypothetical protein [Chloroflexota bacterium]